MKSTKQTAYSNQRKARSKSGNRIAGWDPKIANLFNLGHNFLGFEYSEPGWLYRGGASGLNKVLTTGEFGYFDAEQSVVHLEKELEIYLTTQDFSDAYSLARFWEGTRGSYIAVYKSSCFNRQLHAGKAAVLGFAEPGVVFKYPFVTQPLTLSDIDYLVVSPADYECLDSMPSKGLIESSDNREVEARVEMNLARIKSKVLCPDIDPPKANHRGLFEKALLTLFETHGVKSAVAIPSSQFPKAG